MPEIIIEDKPELRGAARSTIEWVFTSLMWALWIYLFIPMITLVLWTAGVHYIYHSVIEPAALAYLADMLMRLGGAVVIIFIALRGWGYYNYYVFGRLNRRKECKHPCPLEIARHFGLSEQRLLALQNEKEIFWDISHDDLKKADPRIEIPLFEQRKEAKSLLEH
jgi:biofilm PGA synthesis protein PgaD